MVTPAERRRHERFPANIPARFKADAGDAASHFTDLCTVMNISLSSAFLESNTTSGAGRQIKLEIRLSIDEPAAQLVCTIRWVRETEPIGMGVEFADLISAEDLLKAKKIVAG